MIAVIDYGMGNLRSVAKALEKAGAKNVCVTSEPQAISSCDKIVLPGVGAMAEAMAELRRLDLIKAIKDNIFRKPFLGICLGLQLLFETSEEGGAVEGLGVFKGKVLKFGLNLKVPHMGWNSIKVISRKSQVISKECSILRDIPDNSYFYFCHSYYVVPEDKSIIATTTDYGTEFVSSICKNNLFACQFHPEKSQALGLKILKNFVQI